MHNNALEYYNDIEKTILEVESHNPEPLPEELLKYFLEELKTKCESSYQDYIMGKRPDYILFEHEVLECHENATKRVVDEALINLVDKGMVEMSVGEDGDIYYSASDKARRLFEGQ